MDGFESEVKSNKLSSIITPKMKNIITKEI